MLAARPPPHAPPHASCCRGRRAARGAALQSGGVGWDGVGWGGVGWGGVESIEGGAPIRRVTRHGAWGLRVGGQGVGFEGRWAGTQALLRGSVDKDLDAHRLVRTHGTTTEPRPQTRRAVQIEQPRVHGGMLTVRRAALWRTVIPAVPLQLRQRRRRVGQAQGGSLCSSGCLGRLGGCTIAAGERCWEEHPLCFAASQVVEGERQLVRVSQRHQTKVELGRPDCEIRPEGENLEGERQGATVREGGGGTREV